MVLELLLIGTVVVTQLPSGAGTEFNEELKNLSDVALRDVCVGTHLPNLHAYSAWHDHDPTVERTTLHNYYGFCSM